MIDLSKKLYWIIKENEVPDGIIKFSLTNKIDDLVKEKILSLKLGCTIYDYNIDVRKGTDTTSIESVLRENGYIKEPDDNKVRYLITDSSVMVVTRVENKDSETGFCNRLPLVTLSEIKSILSKYDGFEIIYYEDKNNTSYPCSVGFICNIDDIDKVNEVFDLIKSIINYG